MLAKKVRDALLRVRCAAPGSRCDQLPRRTPAPLPQHPDEHRPEHPVLLAVDQQLAERPRRRIPLVAADRVGAVEVGEHQDVEQLGAGSGAERVEALS